MSMSKQLDFTELLTFFCSVPYLLIWFQEREHERTVFRVQNVAIQLLQLLVRLKQLVKTNLKCLNRKLCLKKLNNQLSTLKLVRPFKVWKFSYYLSCNSDFTGKEFLADFRRSKTAILTTLEGLNFKYLGICNSFKV